MKQLPSPKRQRLSLCYVRIVETQTSGVEVVYSIRTAESLNDPKRVLGIEFIREAQLF